MSASTTTRPSRDAQRAPSLRLTMLLAVALVVVLGSAGCAPCPRGYEPDAGGLCLELPSGDRGSPDDDDDSADDDTADDDDDDTVSDDDDDDDDTGPIDWDCDGFDGLQQVDHLPTRTWPAGITMRDGRLYYVAGQNDLMVEIDRDTGVEIDTWAQAHEGVYGLEWADGAFWQVRKGHVVGEYDPMLYRSDEEFSVQTSWALAGGNTNGVTWAPDTGVLWTADKGARQLLKVDPANGDVLAAVEVDETNPPRGVAWAGRRLFVATASSSPTNVDVVSLYSTTGERLASVPVDAADPNGMFPKGIAFDPDPEGPFLLMTDEGDDEGIHVYRIEGCVES